jgi:hypothetical protein
MELVNYLNSFGSMFSYLFIYLFMVRLTSLSVVRTV